MKTLSSKIVLFISLTIFITGSLIAYIVIKFAEEFYINQVEQNLNIEADLIASEVSNSFNNILDIVVMVSETPPIQGIIRSTENKDIDPLDKSTTDIWKKRLANIFTAILSTNENFTQLRYIGIANNGKELVRVDRARNEIFTVSKNALQEKGNSSYFKNTINLTKGSVVFSDADLNREKGKIAFPETSTLRVSMPVYDNEQNIFGIIVLNINYERFLMKILQKSVSTRNVILFDKNYNLITYDYNAKDIKYQHGGLKNNNTNNIDIILKNPDNISIEKIIYATSHKEIPVLNMIISIDKNTLFKNISFIFHKIFLIILVILVLSLLVSVLFSRYLLRSLLEMAKNIKDSDPKDTHLKLPVNNKDEVGVLARAFKDKTKMLHDLAFYDSLTKLPNRENFTDFLQEVIKDHQENKTKFFVLFIDINDFKYINDTYGHHVGDEVLMKLAQKIQTLIRTYDLAARISGDEFCIVLTNIKEAKNIESIIERYKKLLETKIRLSNADSLLVTVSIGISCFPDNASDFESILNLADNNMYEAKKAIRQLGVKKGGIFYEDRLYTTN